MASKKIRVPSTSKARSGTFSKNTPTRKSIDPTSRSPKLRAARKPRTGPYSGY
jgi:hypothetical protein